MNGLETELKKAQSDLYTMLNGRDQGLYFGTDPELKSASSTLYLWKHCCSYRQNSFLLVKDRNIHTNIIFFPILAKMSSFFVPQSDTEPTLLDEIAKLFKCQKRLVRSRLQSPEYHAKAVAEFDESILITTYKDRNGQHRTLIFEGLTREGAHKIPAHGRLHFPFNSILPQFFLDRHNIKLQYPFTPVVIYSPGRSGWKNMRIIFDF